MNHSSKHTRRRKKESFFRQILNNINIFLKGVGVAGRSDSKEYRPYLGSMHTAEATGTDQDEKYNSGLDGKKDYRRSKRSKRPGRLKEWRRRWELRKEDRRKKKYKRKAKKSHKKENRRRARIDFIRKFLPNYKRTKNIPFSELSDEQAAEMIKQQQKNYLYYTVNSTALFIIAYLSVYLLYQLTVLVVAAKFKLDSVLLYYDLAFNDYSPLWSRSNIIIVTLSGPLICLIIAFLSFRFFSTRQKAKGFVKLFFLWIAMIGFNLFLGAWSTGISFDQGFGYVPAWLYLNVFWQIFISLIFLFVLGIIGYYSVPKFLDTSKSAYRVRPENKTKFLFFQVLLPYFIGSIIIILVRIPNNLPYDTGNLVTLLFGIAPMIFNRHARPTVTFEKEKKATNIRWLFIVIFISLVLLYRIGLNNGLHFTLFYDFIFSLDIAPL